MRFFLMAVPLLITAGNAPVWSQRSNAGSSKPLSAFKGVTKTVAQKPPAARAYQKSFRAPARLTAAEYKAMLPQLSTLATAARGPLASQPILTTNLATPGNVLNIGLGTPPPGGGYQAQLPYVVFNYPSLFFNAGHPSPPIAAFSGAPEPGINLKYMGFTAPIQGPGVFLITVYVETTLGRVMVDTYSGSANSEWEFSGPNTISVQNGKVIVVHEATAAHPTELQVFISPPSDARNFELAIFSCDFMRIR